MVKLTKTIIKNTLQSKRGDRIYIYACKKALYGMMKSAVLFYRKLIKELKEMGFEINPYEVWCKLRWVKNS
jgi:hypothetical protein